MRRRTGAGGKPIKTRRRSTAPPKRSNAPKVGGRHTTFSTDANTKIALLTRERDEALEQLSAASEVLKVVSSSPGDLEPVFEAILEKATRICEADFGILFRLDDGVVHVGATLGLPLALTKFMQSVRKPGPYTATARAMRTGQVIHILDVREEKGYREGDPMLVFGTDKVGMRTLVAAPILKDKVPIGSIGIYRTEVRPFTDKQIELLENFAAQAVIAIENTRLLNELRQRTADLSESLEQQTATSEVLRVISSSPGDLEPVFQAMLANAVRICKAKFGALFRFDGEALHLAAEVGTPPEFSEFQRRRGPFQPRAGTQIGRVLHTKQMSHTADYAAEALPGHAATLGGARSFVGVPMLKDDVLIGIIAIYRQEVRPFSDKQIALVENFAAQAVIAIENTRLLNELRESLEQQTATSEVLSVISSSPGELEPVFQAMLQNAVRICDAKFGNLFLYEGGAIRPVAMHGAPSKMLEFFRQNPTIYPKSGGTVDRVLQTKQVVRTLDELANQFPSLVVELGGARSHVVVPMLKDNELVGVIGMYRQEVRAFSDKQIALVESFAAQAVIAIENTRLLNELRQRTDDLTESLEQQTATSEVLKVISSSPGNLEAVFQAMLENATRICDAKSGLLFRADNNGFRIAASFQGQADFIERMKHQAFKLGPLTPVGRAALTRQIVHVLRSL